MSHSMTTDGIVITVVANDKHVPSTGDPACATEAASVRRFTVTVFVLQ